MIRLPKRFSPLISCLSRDEILARRGRNQVSTRRVYFNRFLDSLGRTRSKKTNTPTGFPFFFFFIVSSHGLLAIEIVRLVVGLNG